MRPVLVAHRALYSGKHPDNSEAAILECIGASVARIEVDIHSLDGADYIVSHDRRLTSASGESIPLGKLTPDGVRNLRDAAGARPMLLSELVALLRDSRMEAQLDLKDWRPLTDARMRALSETVDTVKDRIIISTGQDWNLRRLHRFDPEIPYGFDPGHYLDHFIEGQPQFMPRTMGAYGYRDDHPLAYGRTEEPAQYLRERFEMLSLQAPAAREYFLNYRLILQMLADGFDVVAFLGERGAETDAWTLDHSGGESVDTYQRLAAAGVARITTNTLPLWRV